jgi:LPXTG-motif cell wall-anchored protein
MGDDARAIAVGVLVDNRAQTEVTVVSSFTSMGNTTYFYEEPAPVAPGTVTISGTPTVGSVLTANTDGWPAGTTFSYEWFAAQENMGSAVGTDAPDYTPTAEDIGSWIGVIVTGSVEGYTSTEVKSEVTAIVSAPKQPVAPAPVASSAGLAAFLADNGSTPQSQASAGLPEGALNPGNDYTATVGWSAPDSFVDVYLYSSPVTVGTFPVVNGVAQITLSADVLEQLAAGSHTLVIVGQSSGAVASVSIQIAEMLAATGSDVAVPLGAGALLVLAGAALLIYRRRRSIV